MAYDAESDRIILFGGVVENTKFFGDTWAYDFNTNTWTQMSPSRVPSDRCCMAMTYDAESDRVVLFGGLSESLFDLDQTWAYDFNGDTWTSSLSPAPPPRHAVRGAYDAESDRFIVVGGHQGPGGAIMSDAWAYDLNSDTWTNVTLPDFWWASYAAVAYDAESDRVVHLGGERESELASEETWAYDYNTNNWSQRNPALSPPPQWSQNMAYDAESDRIVLFGIDIHGPITWAYHYNENAWTARKPAVQPSARSFHALAYDGESDRLVLFGGCLNFFVLCLRETWAYDYNANVWTPMSPLNLPSTPRDLLAYPGEDQVHLTWKAPFLDGGYAITNYRIYRGTTSSDLSILEEVGVVLTYTDPVASGDPTYYQVSAVTMAGEGPRTPEVLAFSSAPTLEPTDTTDPSITIAAPQDGQTFDNASVSVIGTASDNAGLEKIELSTDGATWQPATGLETWSGTLTLSEGVNTITARATDSSENTATDSVTVTVVLEPQVVDGQIPPGLLIAGAIVASAIGIAVAILLFRRHRKAG